MARAAFLMDGASWAAPGLHGPAPSPALSSFRLCDPLHQYGDSRWIDNRRDPRLTTSWSPR